MTRKSTAKAVVGLSLVSLTYGTESLANVFDTYGQSAGTIAVGNATTAGGTTTFAAYTNPALLVHSNKNEISIQGIMTRHDLQDLPEDPGSPLPPDQDRASKIDDLQGSSAGTNFVLRDWLHLGIAAYLPQGSFGRIKGVSSYQSTYLRYGENHEKPALYTALAAKLPYGLSIGAGAYYTLRAKGVLQVALSSDQTEGRVDLNLEPVIVPYGGIAWQNGEGGTTVGVTYREAQKSDSKIDSAFRLSTEDFSLPFNVSTSIIPFYDPAFFRFGVSQKFTDFQLLFSFEQTQWARFKSSLLAFTGKDIASLSTVSSETNINLCDTQSYRLGTIVPFAGPMDQNFEFRAGVEAHTSTNRPNTSGNVIDPARKSLALGLTWLLKADEEGRKLSIEGAYQYAQLSQMNRTTTRGTPIELKSGRSIQTLVGGLNYEL